MVFVWDCEMHGARCGLTIDSTTKMLVISLQYSQITFCAQAT